MDEQVNIPALLLFFYGGTQCGILWRYSVMSVGDNDLSLRQIRETLKIGVVRRLKFYTEVNQSKSTA